MATPKDAEGAKEELIGWNAAVPRADEPGTNKNHLAFAEFALLAVVPPSLGNGRTRPRNSSPKQGFSPLHSPPIDATSSLPAAQGRWGNQKG